MTPAIPTNATQVEPVYGWAAVAPDGSVDPLHIRSSEASVWPMVVARLYPGNARDYDDLKGTAYRAGWRVIRVQISPAGEREGRS